MKKIPMLVFLIWLCASPELASQTAKPKFAVFHHVVLGATLSSQTIPACIGSGDAPEQAVVDSANAPDSCYKVEDGYTKDGVEDFPMVAFNGAINDIPIQGDIRVMENPDTTISDGTVEGVWFKGSVGDAKGGHRPNLGKIWRGQLPYKQYENWSRNTCHPSRMLLVSFVGANTNRITF
jgi:hypothetical protein